jgi:hypothetical protein
MCNASCTINDRVLLNIVNETMITCNTGLSSLFMIYNNFDINYIFFRIYSLLYGNYFDEIQ